MAYRSQLDERVSTGRWPGTRLLKHLRQGFSVTLPRLGLSLEPLPEAQAIQLGYRLARVAGGKGYVTEACRSVVTYSFEQLCLSEIGGSGSPQNLKSQAVIYRLSIH